MFDIDANGFDFMIGYTDGSYLIKYQYRLIHKLFPCSETHENWNFRIRFCCFFYLHLSLSRALYLVNTIYIEINQEFEIIEDRATK